MGLLPLPPAPSRFAAPAGIGNVDDDRSARGAAAPLVLEHLGELTTSELGLGLVLGLGVGCGIGLVLGCKMGFCGNWVPRIPSGQITRPGAAGPVPP